MGKLMLNDISYSGGGGGGGSSVIPNPQGIPTDTLNTIEIDSTIYDIAGSGSGGDGRSVKIVDTLWEGTITPPTAGTEVALNHKVSDYDVIVITLTATNATYKEIATFQTDSMVIGQDYMLTGYFYANSVALIAFINYTSDTSITVKSTASATPAIYHKIQGIKFCGTLAPQIFSTEEKEIGVWIDDKPLYQKTYDLNNMTVPDNTWTNNLLNTTGTGINITHYEGIFGLGSANYEFSDFSYYRNSGEFFTAMIAVDNDDINIRPNINGGTSVTINRVTIQYTKNSDTPGSGSYGTLGVPMVTYNGDEKVIGTWFGETLYEKSYIIDNLAPNPSDWVNDIQITGIKDIVDIVCSGYLSSGTVSFVAPYITVSYNHTSGYTRHYFRDLGSSGQVTLRTTIRYTKTT